MFDVDWADPNQERVGERKARKAREEEKTRRDSMIDKERAKDTAGHAANVAATATATRPLSSTPTTGFSPPVSSSDKAGGFFGSLRLKNSSVFSRNKSSTAAEQPSIPNSQPRAGHATRPLPPIPTTIGKGLRSISSQAGIPRSPATINGHHFTEYLDSWKTTPVGASGGSTISDPDEPSTPTTALLPAGNAAEEPRYSKTEVIQTLGPKSWISKTTEALTTASQTTVGNLPPIPKGAEDTIPPIQPLRFKSANSASWKPPANWNCETPSRTSPPPATIDSILAMVGPQAVDTSMAMDLAGMIREVRRMASASPEIILVRLKEKWGDAQDPAFFKEIEMEQKRWMLLPLYDLGKLRVGMCSARHSQATVAGQKILALYESQASASYLAGLHPQSTVTHLSPAPLSNRLFPNVQPIASPVLPNPPVSVAPDSFNAVYCLSIASMVPSQSIPALLQNIHRCLVTGGVLNMTLIDPSPAGGTVGPRLHHWLEENLLVNAERQFRCVNPLKVFPGWLADAGLYAVTSVSSTFRLQAAIPPAGEPGSEASSRYSVVDHDQERVGLELRSTVGKALWKEVWGSFVKGDNWWWDDEDIIDECLRLGTYWQYGIIEAAKG